VAATRRQIDLPGLDDLAVDGSRAGRGSYAQMLGENRW